MRPFNFFCSVEKYNEPRINADERRFVNHGICVYLRPSAVNKLERNQALFNLFRKWLMAKKINSESIPEDNKKSQKPVLTR
uniref:Uncharacterized protein n=1 Tax=Candidatus Methanogaster sp. ANME-2c ERB4 TaxID=2759911 RepID=A0A7G9Y3Y8_9EURY|nr:hypothetical protein EABBNKNM_00013 [Methanosarcinales archaeon ANME-2c ERB4]QNO42722.1 hypothetical protein APGODIHH_00011 [Methanosarcinales archaeon ANME-2c ERB4]